MKEGIPKMFSKKMFKTWIYLIFYINLPHEFDLLQSPVSRSQMLHDSFCLPMDAFGKTIPSYVFTYTLQDCGVIC